MAKRSNFGAIRKPPYVATFLATFVVLALLGSLCVLFAQGKTLLTKLRESVKVVIELRPNVEASDKSQLETWLSAQDWSTQNSLTYISKEEGARLLREEFGDDFLRYQLDNPLYEVYTINLSEQIVKSGQFAGVREQLVAQDAVLDVYVQDELVANLAGRVDKLAYASVALSLLLLSGVVLLMLNTTRLSLLNSARLIKNMELVGASWGFISKPFLRRAFVQGALAGSFAALCILALSAFAKTSFASLWAPLPYSLYAVIFGGLVLLGAMLNFVSTFAVVRKTLKLRVDDLALSK